MTEGKVKQGLKEKLSLHNDPVIERAHRIGKKLSSIAPRRTTTVVCRPRDWKERKSLLKLARRIKPDGVYVTEDLTQATIERREGQRETFEEEKRAGKTAYFVNNLISILCSEFYGHDCLQTCRCKTREL